MDSKDLIKAGRLSDARSQLIEEVKSSPADMGKRTLLFQVLSFYGEWDKAERHLGAIAAQDSQKESGVQVYKNLVQAERERLEVSKFSRHPTCFPKSPFYLDMHLEARKTLQAGKVEEAHNLFDEIERKRPGVSGTINGKSFSGFRDTDAFLSLFLETIVHEHYVWVPFESLRELSVSPPKSLFDLLWIPAHVLTLEGLSLNCYLPVLYPDSFRHEDDRIKLGRMTDWTPLGGGFSKAAGQHVFQIGDEELAILEISEVLFTST